MKKFAAFDLDGTLIRWQLYHTLVDRLAKEGALGEDVHQKLHQTRMRWKRREKNYSFSDYEKVLIQSYEAALTKIPLPTFDKLVQTVISEYQDQVYIYTRDLIRKLKQSNYFLIAISGSQHELVEHVAKHYGFDEYAGSTYERKNDKFSGQKMVASHNKKEILAGFIEQHNLTITDSYAVGDSKSDQVMLEMVDHPIAFNPDKALFEVAQRNQWKIVIERKNMTYELEYKDGHYILAETGK